MLFSVGASPERENRNWSQWDRVSVCVLGGGDGVERQIIKREEERAYRMKAKSRMCRMCMRESERG